MSVEIGAHPAGIYEGGAATKALAQILLGESLSGPVVVNLSEGENRTLAEIASFITSGGIWVSGGGYPFYYTPSERGGLGFNFSRFCKLLGVPDPSTLTGSEFFALPGRALTTTTATLPAPWIAGRSPIVVQGKYVWTMLAVPAGSGWWFYAAASDNVQPGPSASGYAAFIAATAAGASAQPVAAAPVSTGLLAPPLRDVILVAGALAVLAGAAVAIEIHAGQRQR